MSDTLSFAPSRPCALVGHLVVIKKSGKDGPKFPLAQLQTTIGRHLQCDIRIQLPHVSKLHTRLVVDENQRVTVENVSTSGTTQLAGGKIVEARTELGHGDVFTIADRAFRMEYLEVTPTKSAAAETPKKSVEVCVPIQPIVAPVIQSQHIPTQSLTAVPSTPLKLLSQNTLASASKAPRATPSMLKSEKKVLLSTTPARIQETPQRVMPESLKQSLTEAAAQISNVRLCQQVKKVLPTPLKKAIKQVQLVQKPAPIKVLATPLKQSIKKGATLKPVPIMIQEEEVEPEPTVVREPTMSLESMLSTETEATIPPAEKTHRRKVMPTPMKQSILEKQSELVKPKPPTQSLPIELKSAIEQIQPVQKPQMVKVLPTPLKQSIKRGTELRPYFAPIPIEMGEVEVPVEPIGTLVQIEVTEPTRAVGRRSMRLAASSEDATVAPVIMNAPFKESLTRAAAELTDKRHEQQVKKVLSTPLKKAISKVQLAQKPAPVKVLDTPLKKAIVSKQKEIAAKAAPAPIKVLATPLKQSIKRGTTLKAVPIVIDEEEEPEPIIVREPTMSLESMLSTETEATIPAAEKTHRRKIMPTPMKESILAKQSELVKPKEPIHTLPIELKSAIQQVQPVQKPQMMKVLATPLKKSIKKGAVLQPYFAPIAVEMGEVAVPVEPIGTLVQIDEIEPTRAVGRRSMRLAASHQDATVAPVIMNTPFKKAIKGGRAGLKAVQKETVTIAEEEEHIAQSIIEVESKGEEVIVAPEPIEEEVKEEDVEIILAAEPEEEVKEDEAVVATTQPAPIASAIIVRAKPISLGPVSRKLISRRQHQQHLQKQSRLKKHISQSRSTAITYAKQKARKMTKASFAHKTIVQAEKSAHIMNELDELLHDTDKHQLDSTTRNLIQPIYEQLCGLKNEMMSMPQTPEVARGCHSTVCTPQTPAAAAISTPSNRRDSIDSIFDQAMVAPVQRRLSQNLRRSPFLPSPSPACIDRLFTPSTPMTPSSFQGEKSLAENLVALMSSPTRDHLPVNTRDSIDSIFASLLGVEINASLSLATEEDIEADNQARNTSASIEDEIKEIEEEATVVREPTMSFESMLSTETEATIPPAEKTHRRKMMATPIKESIVAAAQGFVHHVTKQSMATPMRKAILAKQSELASKAAPAPLKVLNTPLKKSLLSKQQEIASKKAPAPVKVLNTPLKKSLLSKQQELAAKAAPAPIKVIDTPLKKAIVNKQKEIAAKVAPAPIKVLATPLKQAIKRGTTLKSLPAPAIEEEDEEVESDEPVGLTVFDGLEALEEAMYTCKLASAVKSSPTPTKRQSIAPISFSLHAEADSDIVGASPATSRRSSRRFSRQSFHLPLPIPEGVEPIAAPIAAAVEPVPEEEVAPTTTMEEASAAVDLLHEMVMVGVETMIRSQVEVEIAVDQAVLDAEATIESATEEQIEAIVAEAEAEAVTEAAEQIEQPISIVSTEPEAAHIAEPVESAPVVKTPRKTPARGSKRTRASVAPKQEEVVVEEKEAIEVPKQSKRRKTVKAAVVAIVEEEVVPEQIALPVVVEEVKQSKRRKTVKPSAPVEEATVTITVTPAVEEEPPVVAPVSAARSTRRRTVAPKRKAVDEIEPEIPAAVPEAEVIAPIAVEAQAEVAPAKSGRGRKKKVVEVVAEPAPVAVIEPAPVAMAVEPVIEQVVEPVVEVAAPAKRGRGRKATVTIPAPIVEPEVPAPVAAVQPEVVVAPVPAPVQKGRKRKGAAAEEAPAVIAPVEEEKAESVVAEPVVVDEPQSKRTRVGRGKKAAVVVEEETKEMEVVPEAEPVVVPIEPEVKKVTRGRKAAAAATPVVEEPVAMEIEATEPVVAVKATRGRKKAAAVAEPEPEPVVTEVRTTRSTRSHK